MKTMLELLKNYFGIAFILLIVSYLSPKETYRRYFQFMISIILAVILFQPLAEWIFSGADSEKSIEWKQVEEAFSFPEYRVKLEGDLFEYFGLEETPAE